MSTNKPGVRPKHPTGVEARRGIWLKKSDSETPQGAALRRRRAQNMERTYTSVVKVPSLRYTSATDDELKEKKRRIACEKVTSSMKMESRISRFCHAYRLPNPDPNNHSTIAKEAPWLTSRADGTDHTHVVQAAFPSKDTDHDNETIPLSLKQRYYFYKDIGIASWRLAQAEDGETVKLQPSTKNTSFREYAWRLSYLVCQAKREMRMMARHKGEKCGPLPLFSKHSLLKQLEFEMPSESESYRHEAVPIASAVRMLFQNADIESFEKKAALKKGLPYEKRVLPVVSASDADVEEQASVESFDEEVEAIELTGKGAKLTIGNKTRTSANKTEEEPKKRQEEVGTKEEETQESEGDNNSNNGQEEAAECDERTEEAGDVQNEAESTPEPLLEDEVKFPTPIPDSRSPSPLKHSDHDQGRASPNKPHKATSKAGCCAFL